MAGPELRGVVSRRINGNRTLPGPQRGAILEPGTKFSRVFCGETTGLNPAAFGALCPATVAHTVTMNDGDLPLAVPVEESGAGGGGSQSAVPTAVSRTATLSRSLSYSRAIDESADDYMLANGYPHGLREEVKNSCKQFPSRIWILDNSGSMGKCDGKKLLNLKGKQAKQLVQCSRWEELCKSVEFHADLVATLKAPTDFRLLNRSFETGEQYFSISSMDPREMRKQAENVKRIMRASVPHNATPLTMHLNAVRSRIIEELDKLTELGRRIVVVIATDGLPSDSAGKTNNRTKREFRDALKDLQGLPVWVVVRLLTDDSEVVEYWNDIDSEIEVPLEVLDDWMGEAAEIYNHNPWLNYPELMHHVREMGFSHPLFDLIDERRLDVSEMLKFMELLFGQACRELPDPRVDFAGFQDMLDDIVADAGKVITIGEKILIAVNKGQSEKVMKSSVICTPSSWINRSQLKKCYSNKSGACTIS